MKRILPELFLLFSICCLRSEIQAQANCNSDTLFLATGLNHSTNQVDTIGQPDANWIVLSGPMASSLSFPSPGWVIPQYSGWYYTQPGSQWISPFNFAAYGVDNYDTPYVFRYTFCLAQQTVIDMFLPVLCDDLAAVYIDGNLIDSTNSGYRFYQSTIDTFTATNYTLASGTHDLDVHLYNVGGVAMGLDLQGYITSQFQLVTDTCCNTKGCCCGAVYDNHACDGVRDIGNGNVPIDQGLPGWKMSLAGASTYTMNTDINGNYSFVNVDPGSYTLTTSNPSGTPMNTTSVTIKKLDAVNKDVAICSSLLGVNTVDAEASYFNAYPSPATSQFQMDYYLAQPASVSLRIDNIEGQNVLKVMHNENKSVGQYHQNISVEQLPAGIYFYELNADRVYKGKFVKQ